MANQKIELSGAALILGLIFILAIREWFVEVVNDIAALIHRTPVETWFIIAVISLAGMVLLGMKKK